MSRKLLYYFFTNYLNLCYIINGINEVIKVSKRTKEERAEIKEERRLEEEKKIKAREKEKQRVINKNKRRKTILTVVGWIMALTMLFGTLISFLMYFAR